MSGGVRYVREEGRGCRGAGDKKSGFRPSVVEHYDGVVTDGERRRSDTPGRPAKKRFLPAVLEHMTKDRFDVVIRAHHHERTLVSPQPLRSFTHSGDT